MTQDRLRALLQERVAEETMPDVATAAWRRGRAARRRRAVGAVTGVVAATVLAVGAVNTLGPDPTTPTPAPPAASSPFPSTPSTPADAAAPDATARSRPVWFSPSSSEEQSLSTLDQSVVPADVDLSAGAPALADAPIGTAVAAFAVFDESRLDRVLVLGEDGEYRTVDVSGLSRVTKPNGYRLAPVSEGMLSPTGEYLLFPQDGSVQVLRLADATWTGAFIRTTGPCCWGAAWESADRFTVPTYDGDTITALDSYDVTGEPAPFAGDDTLGLVSPFAEEDVQRYGPAIANPSGSRVAQAFGMGSTVPVRDGAMDLPETVYVADDTLPTASGQVLSITWEPDDDRSKNCCPVAGWLDDDTLVYESRSTAPLLVAWQVGTRDFRLVARIGGLDGVHESYVASWALR